MKWKMIVSLTAVVFTFSTSLAFAGANEVYRQQSQTSKMMHKLGRGITNVLTCWVEIPRNIAIEWEKTDPATGTIMGTVKGFGWGFARLSSGVFETFTFPFPVPEGYEPLIEPEFVVTDIWGDPIPGFDEFDYHSTDHPYNSPVYPQRFNY